MNDEVYFWPVDKHGSLVEIDTIILGVCNQPCPKYPKYDVCISMQYLQTNIWDELDFLPADKHKSFLQVDSMGLCSQACPKYPNNKFAVSQGKR